MSGSKKGLAAKAVSRFRSVGAKRVTELNRSLIALEDDPTREDVAAAMMREVHTLKGEAKVVGLKNLSAVSHRIEELMLLARQSGFERRELTSACLEGLDILKGLLDPEIDELEGPILSEAFRENTDPLLADDTRDWESELDGDAGPIRRSALSEVRLTSETSVQIDVGEVRHLAVLAEGVARYQRSLDERLQAVRGELQEILLELRQRQSTQGHDPELLGWIRRVEGLEYDVKSVRELASTSSLELGHLHERLRALRLFRLGEVLNELPRAVRELAHELGKEVRVELYGEEVSVDKAVLESVSEPLIHLVRNAVDHGIESPAERERRGKDRKARLSIRAERRASAVHLEISDDGRGIDVDAVRTRATAIGLEFGAAPDASELLDVLSAPGFSTRASASETSGRGVGLDVVRHEIEAIGGRVELQTAASEGTTFHLTVPITLSVASFFIVRVGEGIVAIPVEKVHECVRISPEQTDQTEVGSVMDWNDMTIPLIALRQALGFHAQSLEDPQELSVLVVGDERPRALVVDALEGAATCVVHPLDRFLERSVLMTGAALLDAHRVAPVLDVAALTLERAEAATTARRRERRSILLVDDSEITRSLVAGTLRSVGHQVVEAVNGAVALERLEKSSFDLLITDLEMPVMDGFDLLSAVAKTHPSLVSVVLSTRGTDSDRSRSLQLGASSYLVKSEFDEEELVRRVEELLP